MKTLTSETWRIELPDDWEQKESTEQDVLLFETADLAKALYLTTLALAPAERRSAAEIARAFSDTSAKAIAVMDAEWKKIGESAGETNGVAGVITDHFAAANAYRIITKVLARPPFAIRGAFHDYLCDDYRASTAYFTPIVDSLVLL